MLGAGFLLVMSVYTLFFKKIVFEGGEDSKVKLMSKRDLVSTFLSGFFMNTLNPSVFLFWFAWTAAISANAEETESPLVYRILVFGTCLLFVLLSPRRGNISCGCLTTILLSDDVTCKPVIPVIIPVTCCLALPSPSNH